MDCVSRFQMAAFYRRSKVEKRSLVSNGCSSSSGISGIPARAWLVVVVIMEVSSWNRNVNIPHIQYTTKIQLYTCYKGCDLCTRRTASILKTTILHSVTWSTMRATTMIPTRLPTKPQKAGVQSSFSSQTMEDHTIPV